jgi:hypothetical protein
MAVSTEAETALHRELTEEHRHPASKSKRGNVANLKRYPKGIKPPQLTPGRTGPNIKTFEAEVRKALQERNGERLVTLARQLVQDAIDAEDASVRIAARAQILPRLWPIVKDQQEGQRVVFEGIRLELTPTGGACVTVARKEEGETNTTDTLAVEQGGSLSLPPGPEGSTASDGST